MQPPKKPIPNQSIVRPMAVQQRNNGSIARSPLVRTQAPVVAQMKKPPVAPPVYRPQPASNTAQAKMANGSLQSRKPPVAPPAYQPQLASQSVQPKMAGALQLPKPMDPPVYRPQPAPIVLQAKQAKAPAASATINRGAAQARVSAPMRTGKGSFRITAGAGSQRVGSVMVHERDKSSIEVTDLGVDSSHRKQGLGNALIASALRAGLQMGKTRVVLNSQDNGSGRLTQWYQSMGFARTGANQRGYPQLEAPISRVLSGVTQRYTGIASAPLVYQGAASSQLPANAYQRGALNAPTGNGIAQRQSAVMAKALSLQLTQPVILTKPRKSRCGCTKCSCSSRKPRRKPPGTIQAHTIQRHVIQRAKTKAVNPAPYARAAKRPKRNDDDEYDEEPSESSDEISDDAACASDSCITAECEVRDSYHTNGQAKPIGTTIRSKFYGGFTPFVKTTWKNNQLALLQGTCNAGEFTCPHCGNCYDITDASIDHIYPVAAHWNTIGRNTDQATRQTWYSNIANLRVVYGRHNSSLGSGGIQYNRYVTTNFTGNQFC